MQRHAAAAEDCARQINERTEIDITIYAAAISSPCSPGVEPEAARIDAARFSYAISDESFRRLAVLV